MKQLVIKQEDIEYFKFRYYSGNAVMNVYVDISKNQKYKLDYIAQECELDYKGLSKKQLVEMIKNSGCLVLGD